MLLPEKSVPNRIIHALFFSGLLLFGFSIALSKSANNIFIGLCYMFAFFLLIRDRGFRSTITGHARQPLLLPLAVYIFVIAIGFLYTENPRDGIEIFNKTSGLLMVYLMVSTLLDWLENVNNVYRNAEMLLIFFLSGILVLDAIALLKYLGFIGHEKFALPLAPLHVHHIWFSNLNAIGMYTAAAFLLFSSWRISPREKIFFISFVLLSAVCVLLSYSRTAWFGMLLTAIVLAYLIIKDKKVLYIILAAVLSAVVLLYFFNEIVFTRLNQIASEISLFFSGETESSIGNRFLMWKAAFKMFLTNPLFGVGTGDYVLTMKSYMASGLFPQYLAEYNQPHNIYLFALATNGLLGLGSLIFLFYTCLRYSLPLLRASGEMQFFGFLTMATAIHFLFAGLTDSLFNIQILRYTFGFVMGVCVRKSLIMGSRNIEAGKHAYDITISSPTPKRF